MAGVSFSGKNLSSVRIVGADLTGAFLDYTDFSGADLTEVNFASAYGYKTMETKDANMTIVAKQQTVSKAIYVGEEISSVKFCPEG